jgi:hypothetical protein
MAVNSVSSMMMRLKVSWKTLAGFLAGKNGQPYKGEVIWQMSQMMTTSSGKSKKIPLFPMRATSPDIDVEDDTPEADRGREPMPKEVVDELEADELEEYSEKVKIRLQADEEGLARRTS